MDTSTDPSNTVLSSSEVDRLFGSFDDLVAKRNFVIGKCLFSRRYFHTLISQELQILVHREYRNVFAFPQVQGEYRPKIVCERGFAFNTPSYLLLQYKKVQGGDLYKVQANYSNQKGLTEFHRTTLNRYVLVYDAIQQVGVSFVDLELLIEDAGPRMLVTQRTPSQDEYYKVLSSVSWSKVSAQIDQLYKSYDEDLEKRHKEHRESWLNFHFYRGRIEGSFRP